MKTILFTLMSIFFVGGAFALDPVPGNNILKAFERDYPDAKNVQWTLDDDTYQAKFNIGESRYWLVLDKKTGEMEYLVSYYSGDGLRPELQKSLLHAFPKATITTVTEISTGSERVYQVNMDAKSKWYVVLMDDEGNVTLKSKYYKSAK